MGKVDSVTTVLQDPYQKYAFRIPPERLQEAAERGSLVHRIIPNLLDPDRFYVPMADKKSPVARGYIQSFMLWHDLMVDETLYIEKELVCDCFQFVGHIDWIGVLIDGSIAILDWKTPITEGRVWRAQLGAYYHLVIKHLHVLIPRLRESKIRIGAIMLSPTGKPGRMKEYTKNVYLHFDDFLIALNYRRTFA